MHIHDTLAQGFDDVLLPFPFAATVVVPLEAAVLGVVDAAVAAVAAGTAAAAATIGVVAAVTPTVTEAVTEAVVVTFGGIGIPQATWHRFQQHASPLALQPRLH